MGTENLSRFDSCGLNYLYLSFLFVPSLLFYFQLVFYVEACESGSLFANNKLPDNMNGKREKLGKSTK